jgi:hypothetical protein
MPRARVSYVTCLAWGLNHQDLPDLLQFYHTQRAILHGVYLMPLVQTWKPEEFQYLPDRMTTEDVERLLADCFPGEGVQFISLGLSSHFLTIAKCFGGVAMPYYGTHPNCESLYLLVSDGEKYVPVERFLKKSLPEVAGALLALERKLLARETRWQTSFLGRTLKALGLRGFTFRLLGKGQTMSLLMRHVRMSRLVRGRGLGKLYHTLAFLGGRLLGRDSIAMRKRHMAVQDALRVIILPLEDDPILETERLERCPSVHVTYHPGTEEFQYIPVCSWRLFSKELLGDMAACYAAPTPEEPAAAAAPATA